MREALRACLWAEAALSSGSQASPSAQGGREDKSTGVWGWHQEAGARTHPALFHLQVTPWRETHVPFTHKETTAHQGGRDQPSAQTTLATLR